MKKIIMLALLLMGLSSVSQGSVLIDSYSHVPCDSWSFNGACNFRGFYTKAAKADSVQRVVHQLDQRIDKLEDALSVLVEENDSLKQQLLDK